jgi:hypothetical protein
MVSIDDLTASCSAEIMGRFSPNFWLIRPEPEISDLLSVRSFDRPLGAGRSGSNCSFDPTSNWDSVVARVAIRLRAVTKGRVLGGRNAKKLCNVTGRNSRIAERMSSVRCPPGLGFPAARCSASKRSARLLISVGC